MVQPLHLLDNLAKIPLLQKVHESTRAVPEVQRDLYSQQLDAKTKNKTQKTQDSKETERNRIHKGQKKETDKKKEKKYLPNSFGNNPKGSETEKLYPENSGRLIDITV